MGNFNSRVMRKWTSMFVLLTFVTSLMAPAIEAASLIPMKVPGRQVLFDLNTASVSEIGSLPGIGPKTAAEIVRYRSKFGPFKTVQDVGLVPGVGKARLSTLVSAHAQGGRSDLALKGGRQTVQAPPAESPLPRRSMTPKPAAPVTLAEVWVTGQNGVRVNVNTGNSKALVSALSRAGFTDVQVNRIANSRLVGNVAGNQLGFQPFANLADLQTRLIATGGRSVIDGQGRQFVSQPPAAPKAPSKASAPVTEAPAPAPSKGMVYSSGERLMLRLEGSGKPVTINLNQQSATGLYKQLRASGVPAETAKAVAQARVKGSFANLADLTARVPSIDSLARAPLRQSQSQPSAPQARVQVHEAEIARLAQQHQAIANRTPSSIQGYDSTLSSLKNTYDSLYKSLARKAFAEGQKPTPESLAKDPRLQNIAKDIDSVSRGKENLAKTQTLNKARAVLDGEISQFSKQAEAVLQRKPTSPQGYDRTIDSLKNTYKDLYQRLEMRARLEGKPATPEALSKDARLQKLSSQIDSTRQAKSDFQTQKAANVEQARLDAERAATRRAEAQAQADAKAKADAQAKLDAQARAKADAQAKLDAQARAKADAQAKLEAQAKAKSLAEAKASELARQQAQKAATPEPVAKLGSRTEYNARIDQLNARAQQLFRQIRAESGGHLTNNQQVWEAAKSYEGKGKLGELRGLSDQIRSLRAERNGRFPQPQQQAKSEPVKQAKAPASEPVQPPRESPAPKVEKAPAAPQETAPAKTMTETQRLSQNAKDLTARLVREGRFGNAGEVYRASEQPGAKGDLARLKSINEQIRTNRAATKGEPVQTAKAPAAPESGLPKAMSETQLLSQQAKDLTAKLVRDGRIGNAGEVYRASEQPGAKGDLARLKSINEQIRTNRAAAKGEPVPTVKASETAGAPAKGTFTETFVENVKTGQVQPASGGWAESYLNLLKSGQVAESGGTVRASKTGQGTVPTGPNWAETYLQTLKGEVGGSAPTGDRGAWLKRLFSRGGSTGSAGTEAGRVVEPIPEILVEEAVPRATRGSEIGGTAEPVNLSQQIKNLQGQAQSLKAKIKSSGQFANNAEIYKASEAAGAKGELAQLKSVNDQIRTLRAARNPATGQPVETVNAPASEPAPAKASQVSEPVQPAKSGGGFWSKIGDWFTGRSRGGATASNQAKSATESAPAAKGAGEAAEAASSKPAQQAKSGGGFWSKLGDWFTGKNRGVAPKATETVTGQPQETLASRASETAGSPRASSLAEAGPLPEMPVQRATAKPALVEPIEAINGQIKTLRTQAHDVASGLIAEGKFANHGEVYRASEAPGAQGKLAELKTLNDGIRSLRTQKGGLVAEPVASTGETVAAPKATAQELVANTASAKAVVAEAAGLGLGTAAAEGAFNVKFGAQTIDLAKATASQIEASSGGLIDGKSAARIADAAQSSGGKLTPAELGKLGLTDTVMGTLKAGHTDAVKTQLETARTQAVEKFGADSEVVKKIDTNLNELKGKPEAAKASQLPVNDVLGARQSQLAQVNSQITQLEGKTGLLARFTKGKQLKTLYDQKAKLEGEIKTLESDPKAHEAANKVYQEKNVKIVAEQARQVQILESQLAKVDPNSRYGRALTERIDQIKATPPESFAKTAKNIFIIAAATNVLLALGRQIKNGEKLDIKAAIGTIANPQFLLGTAGAAAGVYLGQKVAVSRIGLLLTTRLGSFLPPVGRVFLQLLPAFAGGALGATVLGGGLQNADWVQIGAETIGSTLGAAIAMSFFPGMGIFGQIGAAMGGAELAKMLLKMIRGDPESEASGAEGAGGEPEIPDADGEGAGANALTISDFSEQDVEDAFKAMTLYYQRYVEFEKQGAYGDAAQAYERYAAIKARLDAMRNSSFQARTGTN